MQAYLVDASIYIFRAYFSLPENWYAENPRWPTQAVYGFASFLIDLLQSKNPRYLYCAFDESLTQGFRHQLSPSYKQNRVLPDEQLAFQLNACRQLCRVLGVAESASAIYEADDLIGSVASNVRKRGGRNTFVTRDRDLAQLVGADDMYWDFGNSAPVDQRKLQEKLQLRCTQMADFLALTGDPGDSIDGVPGIGPKTARVLLEHFDTVDEILVNLHLLEGLPVRGAKGLAAKISAACQQLLLARQLTTIVTSISDAPGLADIGWQGVDHEGFELFCKDMGLGSGLHRRAKNLPAKERG